MAAADMNLLCVALWNSFSSLPIWTPRSDAVRVTAAELLQFDKEEGRIPYLSPAYMYRAHEINNIKMAATRTCMMEVNVILIHAC
jgi:hypothetical protein